MKPMTSSSSSKSLFHTILFFAATALAVASLTGCSAAAGDENAEAEGATSADPLDQDHAPIKRIALDPNAMTDITPAHGAFGGGGAGGDVDGVTGGAHKKQNIE